MQAYLIHITGHGPGHEGMDLLLKSNIYPFRGTYYADCHGIYLWYAYLRP